MGLSRTAAFYLQASIVLFFLASSSAPTPLYAVYQANWRLSPIAITVVFGSYALAVLGTLLVVGSLSDYVGRRPVLLIATLLQALTMLLFVRANGVGTLLLARVVQGLATGAAAGAVGAGMLDLDRQKGAIANAVAPMLGTATGSLVSGLMAQYLPAPTTLVYLVFGAIFLLQALGVALMPESVARRSGALASLRPHFALPSTLRPALLLAVPVLVAAWSLVGFYGSLGPTLVRRLAGSTSLSLGGLLLFVFAASGATTVFVSRQRAAQHLMTFGTGALMAGVLVTLLALDRTSLTFFFLGTALAGAGFGGAFQGVIRTTVPLAAAHERAGVLSVVYVIAYLAMGLPAVLGGVRAVYGGGLFAAAHEYGAVVLVLAASALFGRLLQHRTRRVTAGLS